MAAFIDDAMDSRRLASTATSQLSLAPVVSFSPLAPASMPTVRHPARAHPFRIAATCTPFAPSRLAGAPCTTCTATTSTARRARQPSAAVPHGTRSAQPLPALAHPRYDAQPALPFLVARAAFVDPVGAATIFSGVTAISILRARLRAQ
ncbi:hypothetical protein C8J57DRAFT_1512877 [Mycena rebaudengoi]|nr:hypothetical protein C8J57DRAFT_1512877 [Mycena rebaudengoi]